MDYVAGPCSVIFRANQTRAILNIAIISNDKMEGNKMFAVSINSSSLPRYVSVSNPHQATVTIMDDDDNGNCINVAI